MIGEKCVFISAQSTHNNSTADTTVYVFTIHILQQLWITIDVCEKRIGRQTVNRFVYGGYSMIYSCWKSNQMWAVNDNRTQDGHLWMCLVKIDGHSKISSINLRFGWYTSDLS